MSVRELQDEVRNLRERLDEVETLLTDVIRELDCYTAWLFEQDSNKAAEFLALGTISNDDRWRQLMFSLRVRARLKKYLIQELTEKDGQLKRKMSMEPVTTPRDVKREGDKTA